MPHRDESGYIGYNNLRGQFAVRQPRQKLTTQTGLIAQKGTPLRRGKMWAGLSR